MRMVYGVTAVFLIIASAPPALSTPSINPVFYYKVEKSTNTFAVYGDMPYMTAKREINGELLTDKEVLDRYIVPKIRLKKDDIRFVVHVGDYGRPGDTCKWGSKRSQAIDFSDYFRWQNIGFFFTPGDNDWTDCNEERFKDTDVTGYNLDPLNNLKEIREWFFEAAARDVSTSNKDYKRAQFKIADVSFPLNQSHYPENQMWQYGDMLFVTIHVVGSENGKQTRDNVSARVTSNENWIDKAVDRVKSKNELSGLAIITHVDPFGDPYKSPWGDKDHKSEFSEYTRCAFSEDYNWLCKKLTDSAKKLRNLGHTRDKPVLFIHGDTYPHCLDKPFPLQENLWRLNAAGDFDTLDADVVSFNRYYTPRPFKAYTIVDGQKVPDVCEYKPKSN
ncbi:hypothetical protein [Microbulbifer variabilis]|uniref:hypothetical protein n=1 Tax=Microbulbifer variabilis TaxID=266805 RepID=UPI001CFDD8DE|nr:hypothetical protein [Microbulbifer variabilis]